ncbi:hypothetical protein SGUI_2131 [Serinicoccus hydrothermalis]|uniref:Uncharacterized protein n=1 Tax=Serinicoccus hydrothermalis TaxID=1758689 RepID=A0A1B1NDL0_9MICO|nr:hypothetical protein [Serinicoccus hydrothermalis]ANS79527.1 hypothetical protein SGUI_2131 [Serinicoccus hydrothermalis]
MGQAWERTKEYLGLQARDPGEQAIVDGPRVCEECFALVPRANVDDHTAWHRRLEPRTR